MNQSPLVSYDEILYPSRTYRNTRPDQLAGVGRVFGMEPADFRSARVLELGCASGGNLIPMAAVFPDSRFVGIDQSKKQIEAGQKNLSELDLDNIELRLLSIMDVEESLGTFDYIIAHGVYSWVSEDVRDKIIAICKENLAANGIAYVSYNTLPGWNMVKTIRDMMIYHTGQFAEPATRILEARRMLNFALENSRGGETPYKQMLKNEVDVLSQVDDNYLFHDHLEHHNEPCYFHEFMTKARDKGLQYVGDSSLASMYLGNFPQEARDTLGQITEIVRQEQYLDFLTNRRFRSTLLCHARVELSRNVPQDRLESFLYLTGMLPKDGFDKIDLSEDQPTEFVNSGTGNTVTTHTRVATAAMWGLAESKMRPLSVDDLVEKAEARLGNVSKEFIRQTFLETAGTLVFNGALEIALDPGCHVGDVSERPKAWPPARHRARTDSRVPNVLHGVVTLGDDLRVLIQYVDGTRTAGDILEKYLAHFLKGELNYNVDEKPVTDEKELRAALEGLVENGLRNLAVNALLVE